MSRTKLVPLLLVMLAAMNAAGAAVFAQNAAATADRTDDISFQQIQLTIDGVIGIDTSGQAWRYDFQKGEFEKTSTISPGSGDGSTDRPRESQELPVEVRCTEEIRLKPVEKSVVVGREEFVDGNISAWGKVTVRGWVKGTVESVNGPVIVSEGGQVDGDIRSPEITIRRGGILMGRQIQTDPLEIPEGLTKSFETVGLWVVFGLTLFFLLSIFLYLTLMPRQVEHFGQCVSRYPMKSALIGLLFVLGLPVIVLLLAITLVGALLIPLVPFAYLLAISLGVVTTSRLIGLRLMRLTQLTESHPMLATASGLLAIMAIWTVVALLMGSASSVAFGFGVAMLVIAILISTFPICAGVGAAVLTRFGFRPHISLRDRLAAEQASVPAPAPPPIRRTTPFDSTGQSTPPPSPPPPAMPEPPPMPQTPPPEGTS